MPALPDSLQISPIKARKVSVAVPGSKSVSNRALIAAAAARGTTVLRGLLRADDTHVMIQALRQLGVRIDDEGGNVKVQGSAGPLPASDGDIDVRYSGTTLRFLLPLLAAGNGDFRLTGQGRMLQRPIQDQLDALAQLGVDATSELDNGCPPVLLRARGLRGGQAEVSGGKSSQYLSGLLLAAPLAGGATAFSVQGQLQSRPFVDITLRVMESFGARLMRSGHDHFAVQPGGYEATDYRVEGDATAAGNFWVAAAVTGASITVSNVGRDSMQGDVALAGVLERMGCRVEWTLGSCTVTGPESGQLRGGEFDLNDLPDQALALAVAGLFTSGPLTITNVPNMRIKETDRLSALATELRRIGAVVHEGPDWLRIEPQADYSAARIRTYADHRMAMAFAVAGLVLPGITILDPGCVDKTYPDYWQDLALLQTSGEAVA